MSVHIVLSNGKPVKSFLDFGDAVDYHNERVTHAAICDLLLYRGVFNPEIAQYSPYSKELQFLIKALNINKDHIEETKKSITQFTIKTLTI